MDQPQSAVSNRHNPRTLVRMGIRETHSVVRIPKSAIGDQKSPVALCLGELLIDLVPEPRGSSLGQARSLRIAPGGAPANVAVALQRLGTRTGFIGKVGDDPLGRHLHETLRQNGLDLALFRVSPEAQTRLALVTNDANERQRFLFYGNADVLLKPEEIRENYIRQARFLHFGSISLICEPSRSATLAAVGFARKHGLTISFDPNLRPPLWPNLRTARAEILKAIRFCDVLKINQFEWDFLFPERRIETDFAFLESLGVQLVAVTRDAAGSRIATRNGCVSVATRRVAVADTTGAGDGFMAALIFQLAQRPASLTAERSELAQLASFANAVGTLTCTRAGAIPAFPSLGRVRKFLRSAGSPT